MSVPVSVVASVSMSMTMKMNMFIIMIMIMNMNMHTDMNRERDTDKSSGCGPSGLQSAQYLNTKKLTMLEPVGFWTKLAQCDIFWSDTGLK
jgi:hypothetical protein